MSAKGATLADMIGKRRVLIVAAPTADDAQLTSQRRALAGWRQGAADRDVSVVELIGGSTIGADDPPAVLRQRFALPAKAFAVVLLGKDGHKAFRASGPATAQRLEDTIDAMPMRKAGQR